MIPPDELSQALKKKRMKTGKTQQKISSLTELSVPQISRIENNHTNYSHQNAYELWKTLKQLEENYKTAEEIMITDIEWAKPEDTVLEVKKKMRENDYSQLPVKKEGKNTGRINSTMLLTAEKPNEKIKNYTGSKYSEVKPQTPVESIKKLVKEDSAVLVSYDKDYKGLITRADII